MLESGRITPKQLVLLLVISRIVIILSNVPELKLMNPVQDFWIACLLFAPFQIIIGLPLYLLAKRFPQQTIIQYSLTLAGKAGQIAAFLLIWYFMHQTAALLASFGFVITTVSMPSTPLLFFSLTVTLVWAYAAYQGIEAIGRLCELVASIALLVIPMITLFLIKDMHLKPLLPVLELGLLPVTGGTLLLVSKTLELLEFAILFPYLNQQPKAKTIYLSTILLMTVILTGSALSILTTFGPSAASRTYPYISIMRLVSVGNLIERVESIYLTSWFLAVFVKGALQYYIIVLGLSQLFKLQSYKPLILPIGTLLIPLSFLVAPSVVELESTFTTSPYITIYNYLFILVLPLVLLLIALIRKKGVHSS